MGVSQVIFNNSSLIDLTQDTVTPESLLQGYTAHAANGDGIVGTASGGGEYSETKDSIIFGYGKEDSYSIPITYFSSLYPLTLIDNKNIANSIRFNLTKDSAKERYSVFTSGNIYINSLSCRYCLHDIILNQLVFNNSFDDMHNYNDYTYNEYINGNTETNIFNFIKPYWIRFDNNVKDLSFALYNSYLGGIYASGIGTNWNKILLSYIINDDNIGKIIIPNNVTNLYKMCSNSQLYINNFTIENINSINNICGLFENSTIIPLYYTNFYSNYIFSNISWIENLDKNNYNCNGLFGIKESITDNNLLPTISSYFDISDINLNNFIIDKEYYNVSRCLFTPALNIDNLYLKGNYGNASHMIYFFNPHYIVEFNNNTNNYELTGSFSGRINNITLIGDNCNYCQLIKTNEYYSVRELLNNIYNLTIIGNNLNTYETVNYGYNYQNSSYNYQLRNSWGLFGISNPEQSYKRIPMNIKIIGNDINMNLFYKYNENRQNLSYANDIIINNLYLEGNNIRLGSRYNVKIVDTAILKGGIGLTNINYNFNIRNLYLDPGIQDRITFNIYLQNICSEIYNVNTKSDIIILYNKINNVISDTYGSLKLNYSYIAWPNANKIFNLNMNICNCYTNNYIEIYSQESSHFLPLDINMHFENFRTINSYNNGKIYGISPLSKFSFSLRKISRNFNFYIKNLIYKGKNNPQESFAANLINAPSSNYYGITNMLGALTLPSLYYNSMYTNNIIPEYHIDIIDDISYISSNMLWGYDCLFRLPSGRYNEIISKANMHININLNCNINFWQNFLDGYLYNNSEMQNVNIFINIAGLTEDFNYYGLLPAFNNKANIYGAISQNYISNINIYGKNWNIKKIDGYITGQSIPYSIYDDHVSLWYNHINIYSY